VTIICLFFISIFSLTTKIIIWAIIGIPLSVVIVFLEVPFCIKCCPTSEKFDNFIKTFELNAWRAVFYLLCAVVYWLSLIVDTSAMILVALLFTIVTILYFIASLKKEERFAALV
jgi:hypothetical protein